MYLHYEYIEGTRAKAEHRLDDAEELDCTPDSHHVEDTNPFIREGVFDYNEVVERLEWFVKEYSRVMSLFKASPNEDAHRTSLIYLSESIHTYNYFLLEMSLNNSWLVMRFE